MYAELKIKIASPEEIKNWSYGEVTKPETINYRTQKPEKDGLFSEAIFGPTKDWECYCGKYRRIRYKGIICDRCGVEVTRSIVRRERMGHIELAAPVTHIWFLRAVPSRIAMVLNVSLPDLEKVVYFASYIITKVNEELKVEAVKKIDSEFKSMIKSAATDTDKDKIKAQREKEKENIKNIKRLRIISELEYRDLSIKYGEVFEVGIGAGAIRRVLEEMNLEEEIKEIDKELKRIDTVSTRQKLIRRLRILKGMANSKIRPEWMILTTIPIIPPALRPMVALDGGRFATSDLNDLYRRVINRNNRLKHLIELKAPEVITKNEKRMLQEAVDALIDNAMRSGQTMTAASTGQKRALKSLADMLKGKHGRFRQNLLGKRVDYSGRSVIVIGPWLSMANCGLPKYMALELFKPFVINYLIKNGLAHNIRSANHLIEQEVPEVWEALDDAIKDKLVLLNRAPTLHRLSVQAFKPILIEGKAIKLPALPTRAFNADFDGDQMAVHLPLTKEAQEEAKNLMLSTKGILKPATGEPVAIATRDITFGCYYLTSIESDAKGEGKIFSSKEEALLAHDYEIVGLRAKIKVKIDGDIRHEEDSSVNSEQESNSSKDNKEKKGGLIETSVGRIIFNKSVPDQMPFLNSAFGQNSLRTLEAEVIDNYGEEAAVRFLDQIKDLGFKYATISGISWGMSDLKIPAEKEQIIKEAEKIVDQNRSLYEQGLLTEHERKSKAFEIWMQVNSQLEKLVSAQYVEKDSVSLMVKSKARGNWGTVNQLSGMRGLMVRPDGQLIEWPIKSNFKEGLNVVEYFISTHGARKGLVDTALRTAMAGYITRRLVDVAQDVVVKEKDCKDTEGYTIFKKDSEITGEIMSRRLVGRTILEDIKDGKKEIAKKGDLLNKDQAKAIEALDPEKVTIRSVLTCKLMDGICQKCYGYDLSKNQLVNIGEAVGIVTAQAIGEPGTQLTMRTFHTGGVASASDITMGLPRVEEIFEARTPSGKALISDSDGKVSSIEEKDKQKVLKMITQKGEEREYLIPAKTAVVVSAGDLITVGQQLTEGAVDLKEFFKNTKDVKELARYIVREVYKIYETTGEGINDKHIELIVRQMFSRVRIIDPGDTNLLPGAVTEKRKALEENAIVKESGKQQATYEELILGITKVSLTTESYLSAASFQETAHVLIDAAVSGASDPLRGLKENVIIGHLIPAGTGFKQ